MTNQTDFQQKMGEMLPDITLRFDEPMARHTSFRIGGGAEVMAFPKDAEELRRILQVSALLDCKLAILGAGTNVLAPDAGIQGLVICLKDCLDGMEQLPDGALRVMAGVTMTRCAVFAANLGLSGLEFAHGIPGTVGGGVYMNAGAYGGEIKDVCRSVTVMSRSGDIRTIPGKDMGFSYRHSALQHGEEIVLSAEFQLTEKPVAEIQARMRELQQKRKASQPLEYPSAGSAFQRPAKGYAAALIDQAGLKGFRIGNAAVSEKHAGFVVNLGGATALDVKKLLQEVAQRVYRESGVTLVPEIRIW